MVCKHESKLGEVLTAATPRLEQRFDADLKEDRILQAQHGGSRKSLTSPEGTILKKMYFIFLQGSCHFHFTKPKHSTPLSPSPKKMKIK